MLINEAKTLYLNSIEENFTMEYDSIIQNLKESIKLSRTLVRINIRFNPLILERVIEKLQNDGYKVEIENGMTLLISGWA